MENVMGNELRESLLGHVDYDPEFEYGRIRHNIWVGACNSNSIVAYFYNSGGNEDIVLFPGNGRDAGYGYDILDFLKKVTRFQARSGRFVDHCDDGPALICFNKRGRLSKIKWAIMGEDITCEANEWIKDMDLPPFYDWDDGHRALFKLRFGGVI